MASKTTEWRPDDCGCVIALDWDPAKRTADGDQPLDAVRHVIRCLAHPNHTAAAVLAEHQAANAALARKA